MFDDFFSDNGAFSKIAGAVIDYEKVQTGYDLTGQAQRAVNDVPQRTNQVNEVQGQAPSSDMGWLTNEMKIAIGAGVAIVALIVLAKK